MMYVATLYNSPDYYRLLSMSTSLRICLVGAHATVAENEDLRRRLVNGGTIMVELIPTCGTYDQIRTIAREHTKETYDRTRVAVDHENGPGRPGYKSPAGPPAAGVAGDQE